MRAFGRFRSIAGQQASSDFPGVTTSKLVAGVDVDPPGAGRFRLPLRDLIDLDLPHEQTEVPQDRVVGERRRAPIDWGRAYAAWRRVVMSDVCLIGMAFGLWRTTRSSGLSEQGLYGGAAELRLWCRTDPIARKIATLERGDPLGVGLDA
jgi:hypothetical protein